MFSRAQRLNSKGAQFVIKRGHSLNGGALRLKWAPARAAPSRATVVVGLTVSKRATARNRLKRQLREALRPLLPILQSPAVLMVFANKNAVGRSFTELQAELTALLKRARLF